MKSLILDLRDNPGGLLSEAIEVASLFLPENSIIVETKGRDGALIASYAASGGPVFAEGDLAIIIDSQTASAAEIVAGAIQDHDRGVIIGGSSYGKGLVQQILMVGNESALKITTSRYHLPSGRCLQIPDWSTFELTVNGGKYYDTDSLYMTESGRPVFGGGGITPDIYVDEEDESEYVEALRREACFFDFATAYIRKNDVQPGFKIDDKIISEFKEYIRDRDFRFEEQDRAAYNNLKNSVNFHDQESEKSLAVLDSRLRSREQSNFDSNYREVGEAIEEEVLLQKFGEKTLYQKWISEQPRIAAAIEILSSAQKYSSIFAQR
jgi:carboxyl-terminal processing protease